MRNIRTTLLMLVVTAMMIAVSSCGSQLTEYDRSSLTDLLENELNIPGDQITLSGNDLSADYNDVMIRATFFDDAEDAHEYFGDLFYDFALKFNNKEMFRGEFKSDSSADSGYVVLRGEDSEAEIFGPEYRMGPVYAGLYYSGSMVMTIIPGNEEAFEDTAAVIDKLGYPNV